MLALATGVGAAGPRAWQQRLQVAVPLTLPYVELEPVNPFARRLEVPPRLLAATVPEDLEVGGTALVAVHVDANGDCREAVVLELPFPGFASPLITELKAQRYEPARIATTAEPSWSVLEIQFSSEVKSGRVVDQALELPDPAQPPAVVDPFATMRSDRLAALPATDPERLSSRATPKRIRVRLPRREVEVGVRLLLHVNESGRCDRFVPVELESGLEAWIGAYLATWRFDPALVEAQPVAAWVTWTARLAVDLGTVKSREFKLVRDRDFAPGPLTPAVAAGAPSAPSPSGG